MDTSERVFGTAQGNEVVTRRRGGTPPWGYKQEILAILGGDFCFTYFHI
jgi:hypothetical protein